MVSARHCTMLYEAIPGSSLALRWSSHLFPPLGCNKKILDFLLSLYSSFQAVMIPYLSVQLVERCRTSFSWSLKDRKNIWILFLKCSLIYLFFLLFNWSHFYVFQLLIVYVADHFISHEPHGSVHCSKQRYMDLLMLTTLLGLLY